MILGILSDTHGDHRRTATAIELLQQCGADAFVHCGDVGGDKVLDQFAGLRTWFVWGNTDTSQTTLAHYAEAIGVSPPRAIPTRIALGRRRVDVYHGHESQFARLIGLLEARKVAEFQRAVSGIDYILHGHTHVAADTRIGELRIINPGALHRASPQTVATLDLATDALSHWVVDDYETGAEPRRYIPR